MINSFIKFQKFSGVQSLLLLFESAFILVFLDFCDFPQNWCSSDESQVSNKIPLKLIRHLGSYELNKPGVIENFFGFVEAQVYSPPLNRPFLSIRTRDGSLVSPIGTFSGHFFSEEIKYALTLGYRFYFIRGYEFSSSDSFFTDYVDEFYKIRSTFPKGSPENAIAKLLLNSLYGRFGMGFENRKHLLIPTTEVNSYFKNFKIYEIAPLGKHTLIYYDPTQDSRTVEHFANVGKYSEKDKNITKGKNLQFLEKNTSFVHVASAITAYARIFMHPYTSDPNVYYTDTDSLYSKKKLPDSVEPSKIYSRISLLTWPSLKLKLIYTDL